MKIVEYLLLGILQGITEFLPVSSSGHLSLVEKLLHLKVDILFIIWVHLATLLALLCFFYKKIIKLFKNRRLLLMVVISSSITGFLSLICRPFIERIFNYPLYIAGALIINGIILLLSKTSSENYRKINFKDALILGMFQTISLIPGISRSGLTISLLLRRKISPVDCFEFSFIVSIPLIIGAFILKLAQLNNVLEIFSSHYLLGFMGAFLSGWISLKILLKLLIYKKFSCFGYYCILVGVVYMVSKYLIF